jgi:hypothetical protein
MIDSARPVAFCTDAELGYDRSRTVFKAGDGLRLDESYRLAHLSLVNPGHPDVIASMPGKAYRLGLHQRIHSLVLPVAMEALRASRAFRALEAEIRSSAFAFKIAWDVMERRQDKLHATIAGSLGEGDDPPVITTEALEAMRALGPVAVRIGGLFSGNVNLGRLYLKIYPEKRGGENMFHRMQDILGRKRTDLYVVGLYNLTDHLTVAEAGALADIVERGWREELLVLDAATLWLMSSVDDLVLDSRIESELRLSR